MTLRLRLLLLLVGIVATGLLVSDVVTYTSIRSFLTTRVDQQLQVAAYPVERALLSSAGLTPQVPFAPPLNTETTPTGTASTVPSSSGAGATSGSTDAGSGTSTSRGAVSSGSASAPSPTGRGLPGGFTSTSRGGTRGLLVPPGTYGELRDANGKVLAHDFFSYGEKSPAEPVIPRSLPGSGSTSTTPYYFSTSSTGSSAVGYRAVATPLRNGGTVVVAIPLNDLNSTLNRLLVVEIVVTVIVLLLLAIVSWFMVRRDLRPLNEMAETAGAIAGGDLTQRVSYVAEGTEVGQLGVAFNSMIGEIEEAFAARAASEDRLRRFLADASHELRTPLTSILGYAELFDLGVRDRPADLATSMRHIQHEAMRMGTLVDDLFLLAQLDHERPLGRDPVDLDAVAIVAVEGAQVSAPERQINLVIEQPVRVIGDEYRLRQVIDNLLNNAVEHTPSSVAISVRIGAAQGRAFVEVHDDGPGIPSADRKRIFEPFFRADPSRSRSTGGAGLGLAIVSAVVSAHQGTVSILDGPGATFRVELPLQGPDRPAERDGWSRSESPGVVRSDQSTVVP